MSESRHEASDPTDVLDSKPERFTRTNRPLRIDPGRDYNKETKEGEFGGRMEGRPYLRCSSWTVKMEGVLRKGLTGRRSGPDRPNSRTYREFSQVSPRP